MSHPRLKDRLYRRRDIILLAMGATYGVILASCSRGNEGGDEVAADGSETTATITILESSTSTPTEPPNATPLPSLELSDAVDASNLEIVRSEALNVYGHYDDVRVAEDGTRHLIPLDAVEWGGVARDGIPAINQPDYVGPERWYEMVYDPEGLVIGVEVNGKHRAYPLQILIWHEIVNETFDGKHLLVTY